ncbi:anti-sigma factor [Pedobacter sandarakinus]|uniref:anti-sigma factor n=1 Tax=Pedobacter sandarakinus TaxID=353156 RepID=UPI002246E4E1|nr:anti-sigma factor [Pedobacter sandarakinus]MCX2573862.1 anti-sigma factor [Pedobacter sandarakinus]
MNNRLENFVKENRRGFDFMEPPAGLWDKIEKELDSKKQKKPLKLHLWFSAAAAVVIVLGLGWFYTQTMQQNDLELADVNAAYAKKEVHFAGLITEKRDSLAIFAAANPELYRKFTADLRKLDEEYERLKNELPVSPNQTFVVKAMVKNREIQLQLLKQQLLIINQVDDSKRVNQI